MGDFLLTALILNTGLLGYAIGDAEPFPTLAAVMVVEVFLLLCVAWGVDLEPEELRVVERDYARELLEETLAEYGPAEYHDDCDCTGCCARRYLEHSPADV